MSLWSRHQILQRLVIIIWFCRSVQHHYYDEMASFLKRVKRAVELLQRVSPLIWEYIFMLYEEMPREVPCRNPSCYKKEVRIYFDNTIVVCWNHKGRGNLLDFFSWVDLSNVTVCTHLYLLYIWLDWRNEGCSATTQSLDQAKFTNVIPEALFLLSLLPVILLPSRVSMYCGAHNVWKNQKCLIWSFPLIFVLLKLTHLVTLFDRNEKWPWKIMR